MSDKRSPTLGRKEASPSTLPGTLNYQSLLSLTALSPAGHQHSPTLDQVCFVFPRHQFISYLSSSYIYKKINNYRSSLTALLSFHFTTPHRWTDKACVGTAAWRRLPPPWPPPQCPSPPQSPPRSCRTTTAESSQLVARSSLSERLLPALSRGVDALMGLHINFLLAPTPLRKLILEFRLPLLPRPRRKVPRFLGVCISPAACHKGLTFVWLPLVLTTTCLVA